MLYPSILPMDLGEQRKILSSEKSVLRDIYGTARNKTMRDVR